MQFFVYGTFSININCFKRLSSLSTFMFFDVLMFTNLQIIVVIFLYYCCNIRCIKIFFIRNVTLYSMLHHNSTVYHSPLAELTETSVQYPL